MDEIKKNTDEGWKESVAKEKETLKKEGKFAPPSPDFNFFVTTLAMQTAIALGEIANPADNKKEENLPQAQFLIDTLGMLKEKTKGNLSADETKLLDNVLYELRTQYIAKTQEGVK